MDFLKKYGLPAGMLFILSLFVMSGINTVPALDADVKAKWSEVENQYRLRAVLIQDLADTVRGYATHEKLTLAEAAEAQENAARAAFPAENLTDPETMKRFEAAQNALSVVRAHLLSAAESYPDLKADRKFLALQPQLAESDTRIAAARKDYTGAAHNFNANVRTLRGFVWAAVYGAKPKATFTAAAGAETAPRASLETAGALGDGLSEKP